MKRFCRSSCFTSSLAAGGVLLALVLSGCAPEPPGKPEPKKPAEPVKKIEAPVTVEMPATPAEKPIKTEEKPIKTEEKPIKTEEKPIKAEEKPAATEEKPIKAEEKPAKTDEAPKPETKPETKPDDSAKGLSGDLPAAPKVSTFAPVADLEAQMKKYVADLVKATASEEAYKDLPEGKISRDASTVAVLALALGLHDKPSTYKEHAGAMIPPRRSWPRRPITSRPRRPPPTSRRPPRARPKASSSGSRSPP